MPVPVSISRHTFRKTERLCSRKILQEVAIKGRNVSAGPIRIAWLPLSFQSGSPAVTAFSVSKKNFKLAVERNRIKRRMREAFRKNKNSLYAFLLKQQSQIAILLVYNSKESLSFREIEIKITDLLAKLAEDVQKNSR